MTIGRFDQLQEAARKLVNSQPAICVFMKPRMSGTRHVKELTDRVVITWSLSEPAGGIQDFTWVPTVNRFQAVLHKSGLIEMSYDQLTARGRHRRRLSAGHRRASRSRIASLKRSATDAALPGHLDATSVRLASVDGLYLKVTFETRGPVLPEGDPGLSGIDYQVALKNARRRARRPRPRECQSRLDRSRHECRWPRRARRDWNRAAVRGCRSWSVGGGHRQRQYGLGPGHPAEGIQDARQVSVSPRGSPQDQRAGPQTTSRRSR